MIVQDIWFLLPNLVCYSCYHLLIIFINEITPSTIVIWRYIPTV